MTDYQKEKELDWVYYRSICLKSNAIKAIPFKLSQVKIC